MEHACSHPMLRGQTSKEPSLQVGLKGLLKVSLPHFSKYNRALHYLRKSPVTEPGLHSLQETAHWCSTCVHKPTSRWLCPLLSGAWTTYTRTDSHVERTAETVCCRKSRCSPQPQLLHESLGLTEVMVFRECEPRGFWLEPAIWCLVEFWCFLFV